MFRSLSLVGVASAAIIESRPHEHLQIANAQLQNATEAVIKTAAVAGLAYAGAYMAAAGTTPGAYDSSRRSQASSTGQRYCDTRETDPLKYKCTAEYFNGAKADNAAASQAKVAIRNYWCCPASDLGGKYIGDLNGVCVNTNQGSSVFAAPVQGQGGCVYQGPCIGGSTAYPVAGFTPALEAKQTGSGEAIVAGETGKCDANGFVQTDATLASGIFGGSPGGSSTPGQSAAVAGSAATVVGQPAAYLGAASGAAYYNGADAFKCCVKTNQGDDGTNVYDLNPATLKQPISFCIPTTVASPSEYTCDQ